MEVLERLYAIFRIAPFGSPKLRALKKEQKHYHFDWSLVPEEGPRFENMVASHILKWIHYQQDCEGRELELRYFRDADGREVNFVLLERAKPFLFVECKLRDRSPAPSLRYLKERFPNVRAVQVVAFGTERLVSKEHVEIVLAHNSMLPKL